MKNRLHCESTLTLFNQDEKHALLQHHYPSQSRHLHATSALPRISPMNGEELEQSDCTKTIPLSGGNENIRTLNTLVKKLVDKI